MVGRTTVGNTVHMNTETNLVFVQVPGRTFSGTPVRHLWVLTPSDHFSNTIAYLRLVFRHLYLAIQLLAAGCSTCPSEFIS